VAEPLTLYQTEWCPFSSAVREVLTELGLSFVARQVEPVPEERGELRSLAGTDRIPVLQAEDGALYRGTREIFAYLRRREPSPFAAGHRKRFHDHRDARETDVPGQLLEYFRGTDELQAGRGAPADAVVVDVPELNRYELRLGGQLIGLLAYRPRNGRLVMTHTEVDEKCSNRGFGTKLALAALDDARRRGLAVLPLCPFVAYQIEQHPEYHELVVSGYHDLKEE
jgi:predicted GNAT family acetyltransferase/glutaredoxin